MKLADNGEPALDHDRVPDGKTLAYDRYYASGRYDARYPRPNPVVLETVRAVMPRTPPRVIDFGCGSGRYTLALAPLSAAVVGYDISAEALQRAKQAWRSKGAPDNVSFTDAGVFTPEHHRARHGPADLALALFGVLAHIADNEERTAVLRDLRRSLAEQASRLVVSVPNRHRRFRTEQREAGGSCRVTYRRRLADDDIELFYQLYDRHTLRHELEAAGFVVERLIAESLFPERIVAESRLARVVERVVTPRLPAGMGYGLLAVARPRAEGDRHG